ncbi:MAG: hypothetical protein M3281_04115 [Chloroflexota bacterium]|nr:hypothetical protein [Chloroflexota bacterium]
MSFTNPNIVDTEPDPMSDAIPDTGAPEDADAGLDTDVNIDTSPEADTDTLTERERRDNIIDREAGA